MQKYKEAALRKELELERKRLRTSERNEDTDYPHAVRVLSFKPEVFGHCDGSC